MMRKEDAADSSSARKNDDDIDYDALVKHFSCDTDTDTDTDGEKVSSIFEADLEVAATCQAHKMDRGNGCPGLQQDDASSSLEFSVCNAEQEIDLSAVTLDHMEADCGTDSFFFRLQFVPPIPPSDSQRPAEFVANSTEVRFAEISERCEALSVSDYDVECISARHTTRRSPDFATTTEESVDCTHGRHVQLKQSRPDCASLPHVPPLTLQVTAAQPQPCRASTREQAHQHPEHHTAGHGHLPRPFSLEIPGTVALVREPSGQKECRCDEVTGTFRHEVFQSRRRQSHCRLPSPPSPPKMTSHSEEFERIGITTSKKPDLLPTTSSSGEFSSAQHSQQAEEEPFVRRAPGSPNALHFLPAKDLEKQNSSPAPPITSPFPPSSSPTTVPPSTASGSSSVIRKTDFITEKKITEHDVLYGRGGKANNWPGNVRLRELVRKHKKEYFYPSTSKARKTELADSIVNEIKSRGRFLEERAPFTSFPLANISVSTSSVCWVEVPWGRARKKVSQRFRQERTESDWVTS